jgi:outer membrane protein OmpA-like peptidoglycan-associated protein
MKQRVARMVACVVVLISSCVLGLQAQSAVAQGKPGQPVASGVLTGTTSAVSYTVGGSASKVDMIGTKLAPAATGEAKVEIKSKTGMAQVEASLTGMKPAWNLGTEFLTYVLWAVTPEGTTDNLGELLISKYGEAKLKTTTSAQTFSLIVTAEPYFAVRIPSEMVVLQSKVRKDTKGKIVPVSEYKLMRRAQYQKAVNPLALTLDPKVPFDLYQARNAVEIAKAHGAATDAPDIFSKAEASLQTAEKAFANKKSKKAIVSPARQAVQYAEDARSFAAEKQEERRIAQEREEAAAQAAAKAKTEAEAKAAAEAAEAKRIADAKAAQALAEAEAKAAAEAAEAKRVAEAQAAQAKAEAEAKAAAEAAEAKRKADAEIAAKEAALKAAEEQKAAAEREKQELRARLLEQFNRVLPTTDTPRGLVVNMGDVLFDTGQSNLRQPAREALAKLSGIMLNYPTLHLTIEGYTDSTGSAEYNQSLSEKRAYAVQSYLVSMGLDPRGMTAQGFGMNNPVADNSTAAGRQKNRRVEIVVSGEVIGTQIGVQMGANVGN